jgi:hypothetical protein
MEDKTGDFLRDVFLDAIESLKENDSEVIRKFHELFAPAIKKAKEGYIDSRSIHHEMAIVSDEYPDVQEYYLAYSYAIELASLIPEASTRATNILSTATRRQMDAVAHKYIEEASKCYVFGYYLSSAIMCRASIEYSLKKYLNIVDIENESSERFSMHYLINEAIKRRGPFSFNDKKIVLNIHNASSDCVHGRRHINSY